VSGSSSTSSTDDHEPPRLLEVGRVTRAHGLAGDVVVAPISNAPSRFAPGAVLDLRGRAVRVTRVRSQGDHIVVHFDGVDDRTAAEQLRGAVLLGEPLGAPPEGEVWVHELIGCTAFDTHGNELGRVEAVQDNPAHDLLVLEGGALIPMPFVVEHEAATRRVVVDPPAGLLDLFR
jgi:16S rRNA processing protein RimM